MARQSEQSEFAGCRFTRLRWPCGSADTRFGIHLLARSDLGQQAIRTTVLENMRRLGGLPRARPLVWELLATRP